MDDRKMKLLLVGDWPEYVGGVCNYTRPLHYSFGNMGYETVYFFSGAHRGNYHFRFGSYSRIYRKTDKISWHELVNGANGVHNYYTARLDSNSKAIEKLFHKLLQDTKPNIVHVHEMIGLPSSVIALAKKARAKVLVTVHEYWWLCMHRAMIDYSGDDCEGPSDLSKCAICVERRRMGYHKPAYYKMRFALRNDFPFVYKRVASLKSKIHVNHGSGSPTQVGRASSELRSVANARLEATLTERLAKNIATLNSADLILAVSNDVKTKLVRYGVSEQRIMVNHIGSEIAERKPTIVRAPSSRLRIGYIGGVGYYKGVHVLVEAFAKLSAEMRSKAICQIYGQGDESYISGLRGRFKFEDIGVEYLGRYTRDDLDRILSGIDLMVLPSVSSDTAPQTIFESFAAGIPILASNIGGFPDFVDDGKNGLLFKAGDPNDLKEKLEMVIEKPEMIDAFRRNIPRLKTISENADELVKIYSSLY